MDATHASLYCCCLMTAFLLSMPPLSSASVTEETTQINQEQLPAKKIELYDGVYMAVPKHNDTEKIISFEIQTENNAAEQGRGKKKKLLQRLLPMFIVPFLIQSTIVPFFLSMLKFMLFKSLMVGKVALGLILLNAFKNSNSFKGRDAEVANVHYGYHGNGMEEYGAYFN